MGGEWTRGRGDTSQERDKLVEVLSTSRMVVILGGSEAGGEQIYSMKAKPAGADNLAINLPPAAQFNLQN